MLKQEISLEFELLSEIKHANIPKVKEIVEDDNGIYIIMEYLDGYSLLAWSDIHS